MSAERQKEIARKGGRAAHECGKAHEFTADEARAAGRKGGEAVSANRVHMSEIGRLGGRRSAGRRAANAGQAAIHASTTQQVTASTPTQELVGQVHGHSGVNQENAAADNAQKQPE